MTDRKITPFSVAGSQLEAVAAPIAVSISASQPNNIVAARRAGVEILARIAERDGIRGEPAKRLKGRSERVGRG